MGVYLSTPCREVEGGQGEAAGVKFGFGEMQVRAPQTHPQPLVQLHVGSSPPAAATEG